MRKKLLLMSLLVTSLSASAQFNWLSNGDFEAADKTLETVTSTSAAAKGDWATYLVDGKTGFSVGLETDDATHNKVAKIVVADGNPSWYQGYLMQNVEYPLKAEKFQLVFDAKCTSGASLNLSAWIYIDNGKSYALKTGFDKEKTPGASGARYDQNTTAEWKTFTLDFDFAQKCNDINSPQSKGDAWVASATTEAELASCRVAFNTNKKVGTVLVDNVKLIPINPDTKPDGLDPNPDPDPDPQPDPDPEFPTYVDVPDNGPLLQNNGFDVESIQTWRTKDEAKFLGYTGTWYFYAEPEKDIPTDASTVEVKVSEDSHGKVVALTNTNAVNINSWWGRDLIQRLGAKVKPVTYRLGFYARSASGAKGKVNIALKKKEGTKVSGYALFDGFVPEEHPKSSGTTLEFSTSTEWQYFEQVFDFSKMANSIWSLGTSDKILPVEDEELFKNVYLCFWNNTASSTLEIDDVSLELMETNTSILNPGFEENVALPIKIGTDLAVGAHSGQWVLVNTYGKTDVSISDEPHSGTKSMQVTTTELGRYPRSQQYLALDLYEVPAGDYLFKFANKSDKAEAPIRIDVYVYSDESNFQAVTGTDGDKYETVGDADKGLVVYKTTTNWTEYNQKVKVQENAVVRLIIRPNITGTGSHGAPEDFTLPVSYWFDDFSFEKDTDVSIHAGGAVSKVNVYASEGEVKIAGLENATAAIYNINGSLIDQISGVNGTIGRSLMQGSYIVKVVSNDITHTAKVLVK